MKNLVILFAFIMTIGCYDDSETPAPAPSIIDVPIIEQEGIMLKAIKESPNYFFKDNKVIYSIDSNGIEQQFIIDKDDNDLELVDFFRKDGKSYFIIRTYIEIDNPNYDETCDIEDPDTNFCEPMFITEEKLLYYKQVDGNVTKITSLPVRPTIERTVYESEDWSIQHNEYVGPDYPNGVQVSDVHNKNLERFMMRVFLVNGAVAEIPGVGMYFHVKDGLYNDTHMVHLNGLYFVTLNSVNPQRIMETGDLW